MASNMTTLFVTLQFLESVKRETCEKHRNSYTNCVKNKNNSFQNCYYLHMEKFENCMKSLEIIKQMNENEY